MHIHLRKAAAFAAFALMPFCAFAEPVTLRVGHFPNVTHIQGLIGHALTRAGKGWFEQRLGPDVKIDWYVYNAGPSAMEAIFARSVDLTYVGPSPAINAYAKAGGREVRIVAGAANGGSALVVQPDLPAAAPADLKGRKIATPQLGNTQDVAARAWFAKGGLRVTLTGGDVQIVPTANPDQLTLFKTRQIDAVWTVEPWVSRLEVEAGAKVALEEPAAVATVLVASEKALTERRALVKAFVAAHHELTDWIKTHPAEAQELVRAELSEEVRAAIAPDLIARAWKRITLVRDADVDDLKAFVDNAQKAGLLKSAPNLTQLVETP